jgi:hypothetical protein
VRLKLINNFTDFGKGFISGFILTAILFGIAAGLMHRHYKDKEIIRYVEMQNEVQELREDYINRDPVEFLESIPGAWGAVDGASAEFLRKRDEALRAFRQRRNAK